MKYEKRDELSMMVAERINLSPHEHTWTADEQFEMARHLLKCRKMITSLVSGLSELMTGGYGVRDEAKEIIDNAGCREYLFQVKKEGEQQ